MPWSRAAALARSGRREQMAAVSKSGFSRSADKCNDAPKPVPMTPTRIGSLGLGSNMVPGRGWGWLTLLHVPGVTEERPGDGWDTECSGGRMLPHPLGEPPTCSGLVSLAYYRLVTPIAGDFFQPVAPQRRAAGDAGVAPTTALYFCAP